MSEEKIILRKDFLEYIKIERTQVPLDDIEDMSDIELDIDMKKTEDLMEMIRNISKNIENDNIAIINADYYHEFLNYLENEEYEKMVKFKLV
jgi:hypothetical protein